MKNAWNKFKDIVFIVTIVFIILYLKDHPIEVPLESLGQQIYTYITNLFK